jgi:hypothetical protein
VPYFGNYTTISRKLSLWRDSHFGFNRQWGKRFWTDENDAKRFGNDPEAFSRASKLLGTTTEAFEMTSKADSGPT